MRRAAFVFGVLAIAASVAAGQPIPGPEEAVQDRSADPEQEKPPTPAQEPRRAPRREIFLDRPHEFLSRRLEDYARKLDDFLSDPNRAYDSTGSTLQIRSNVTFFEGGLTEGKADVRANISLPNTQDRLKLIVQRGLEAGTQTAAERDIRNAVETTQVNAPAAAQDNKYYLGLKALVAEVFGVTLSGEAGAKFGQPVDPYVRLRAFRDFIYSQWVIRASETPLWKRPEGSSAASEIAMLRPFNDEWQLRLTSKATWRSTTNYFDLAQIGSLYFTPDKRTAYTFELGAFAPSDRSLNLNVYSVTLRARRQIYQDWLYLEVTPQVLYQETNGFSPASSLMLHIEALFGDRYLQP